MTHISYSGSISPAIWLSFKGHKATGAHTDADDDYAYNIANECLYQWEIIFDTGSRFHHMVRRARRGRRYFNDRLNTYLNPPVSAAVLNEILHAHDAGSLNIYVTCKVWYHKFFRHILNYLRRTSSDLHNLANPTDEAAVRASFRHRGSRRYSYVREEKELRDIPAILSGYHIVPAAGGSGPPGVKLYIYLKSKEDLSRNDADDITETFVAADYSKINRFGRQRANAWYYSPATVPNIEVCLETWERNTWQYFLNYTDLSRGERLFNHIKARARARQAGGGGQANVIQTVRNEIDRLVITANHWGQRREDRTRESYQYHLSNVFGSIHQSRWRASPVRIIRRLEGRHSYNYPESAAFVLQVGCGHCGEHATTSYAILASLHSGGMGALLGSIVNSGNANIDHAFVVGGIRPTEVIETTVNNPRSGSGSIGDAITVWDLRGALTAAGAGVEGYVCDPYLDPSQIAQTARRLLTSLNSSRKRTRGLDTDHLYFGAVHPAAPSLSRRSVGSVRNV